MKGAYNRLMHPSALFSDILKLVSHSLSLFCMGQVTLRSLSALVGTLVPWWLVWGLGLGSNLQAASSLARTPSHDSELRYWLENMITHHHFSVSEAASATGLSHPQIEKAMQEWSIQPVTSTRPSLPWRPPSPHWVSGRGHRSSARNQGQCLCSLERRRLCRIGYPRGHLVEFGTDLLGPYPHSHGLG